MLHPHTALLLQEPPLSLPGMPCDPSLACHQPQLKLLTEAWHVCWQATHLPRAAPLLVMEEAACRQQCQWLQPADGYQAEHSMQPGLRCAVGSHLNFS